MRRPFYRETKEGGKKKSNAHVRGDADSRVNTPG